MMHYKKGINVEPELTTADIPIENLPEKFLWMHVKGGTKTSNVVDFAKKAFASGEHRCVVWTGEEGGVGKAISCAEIMKRGMDVCQVTRFSYKKVEECWDPIIAGLEQIVATKQIPCVHILLSLDKIDGKTLGFQTSKSLTSFWIEESNTKTPRANKTPSKSGFTSRKQNSVGNKQSKSSMKQKPKPEIASPQVMDES